MMLRRIAEIPGGDDFEDVTEIFAQATSEMDSEELILTDGFTLMDAMSAFEIGEPRMDSGMVIEEQQRPPFDPLFPLLPQEVCWILDRMFACEMEWHAGNSLSQTVYTLLYIHYLPNINPDLMPRRAESSTRQSRPMELLTVVLRAGVFGLLKSCDFSWRELSRGKVHEIEDWFGEKCDVSLLEGVAAEFVLKKLDDAYEWLHLSQVPSPEVSQLCDRILLRKTIVQLLKLALPLDPSEIRSLVARARELLKNIRARPPQEPAPDSPAVLAFDPYISRRLSNFMPIRVIPLPSQDQTWDALAHFLDGYEELSCLLENPCLSTWEVPSESLHLLRSTSFSEILQSSVYERGLVFGRSSPVWLVDRFFQEAIGVSRETILRSIGFEDISIAQSLFRDIERRISKVMVGHVRAQWHNPPRRRRYLAKSVLQWHELFDQFMQLSAHCTPATPQDRIVLEYLPNAAAMRRLTAAREVILSGFEQDLYSSPEVPVAYWHLARVLDVYLTCQDEVLSFVSEDWEGYGEMLFQSALSTALQMMATAICAITYKQSTWSYKRTSLNFLRRYKWAFYPEYDNLVPALPLPDLRLFSTQVTEMLQDERYSPSASFRQAGDILSTISRDDQPQGFAGPWAADRRDFVHNLVELCRRMEASTADIATIASFDVRTLNWQGRSHPWFPDIVAV